MLKKVIDGIAAGVLISIGGSVFLACDNKIAGSILFTVALLCICIKGYSLFTGKVGYLAESRTKENWSVLLLGLLGNAIATILCGFLIRFAIASSGETANTICSSKLTQAPLSTFIRGIFCGMLMYLAVSIYRDKQTIAGILFCVPVFILSGFEHSIADIFYFAASGIVSLKAFGFLWIVILGNSVGAIVMALLSHAGRKEQKNG